MAEMDVFGPIAGGQRAYLREALLQAAHELRLGEALPATAEEAARKLKLRGARRLRRLLDALAVLGLARRQGEVFEFHPAPYEKTAGAWGELARVIRADEPLAEPSGEEALRRFHSYLLGAGEGPARDLWKAIDTKGPLLDLGGGAGVYTAAFLEAHPGEEAILADRPEVLALAHLPGARLLALDILNTQLPRVQTVLLANVLHLFGEQDCRKILSRAAAAAKLVIVKDLDIEPDRSGPAEGVLFALNMALFTENGDVHDPQALASWMRGAGLAEPRRIPLGTSLVLAAASP
jgi:hypothetical protein